MNQAFEAALRRLPLRLDPARLRFWGVVLPIHAAAFLTLYLGMYALLEQAYSHAGMAAAHRQLDEAIREVPFMTPAPGGARPNPHLFSHLLVLHQPIGLRIYGRGGRPMGLPMISPDRDDFERAGRFLSDAHRSDEIWIEDQDGQQWVRGVVRLTSGKACLPCHQLDETLGAATMKIDYTRELTAIHRSLGLRVGLLLATWLFLVGGVAIVVQRTVRRSLSRLETDLAAAAAGRRPSGADPALHLDPATAELHRRLRDFLRRQREREAEVASRLAHVDQLASLGQLSAGLAHEIKNPLAGIQGALEVLKHETADEPTARLYDEMLDELGRVNGILQRLLESGRPAPLRLTRTDLPRLVTETVGLLQPALRRKKVELRAELAADLPALQLDAAKVRQVLVNLIQNAAEAMGEGGGHVTVRATTLSEVAGVVVAVEDDGPGISRADLDRLFQPFFTTKFSGTGLGLTISKGLVEQHGGRVEVDTEVGRGTTFFLFFPGAGSAAPEDPVEEVA